MTSKQQNSICGICSHHTVFNENTNCSNFVPLYHIVFVYVGYIYLYSISRRTLAILITQKRKITNMSFSTLNQSFDSSKIVSTFGLYLSSAETASVISFFVFFGTVGFLENFILIPSILLTDQFADTPSNIFILSLACADLLVCGLSVPLFVYNCCHPIFAIFATVSKFNAVASTGSIFTLSLDRYISLVRGLQYQKVMTFKRTISLVAGTWIAASSVVTFSTIDLRIARYFLGFYILTTIVMYMYMYNIGRKHRKDLARQVHAVAGQIQARIDDFRALRSLFMIAGNFVVFWSPMTVVSFLTDVKKKSRSILSSPCVHRFILYFKLSGRSCGLLLLKQRISQVSKGVGKANEKCGMLRMLVR